jgi:hypothetical protein
MWVDEQSEPVHFFLDAGELRMSHWSNPSPRHPKERSEVSTAIDAGHFGGNCCTDTPSKILLYTCNPCVAVTLPPTRIQHFPRYRTLNLSPLRRCRHSPVPYSHLRSTIAVTNKLRNVQASSIVPPRPPRLRLPPSDRAKRRSRAQTGIPLPGVPRHHAPSTVGILDCSSGLSIWNSAAAFATTKAR